jgi:acetyltransferase
MIELARRTNKPLVIYSLYAPIRPPALRRLHESGLPVYSSLENAVRVLAALGERGIYLAARADNAIVPAVVPCSEVQGLFATAQNEGRDLFEFEAKALLHAHGVAVPEEMVVHGPDELPDAVARFGDQPLAMKVVSKDILHKSDAGGVKLNIRGEADLRGAYARILKSCHEYAPEAAIRGVLVTPMARKGTEVIIGVIRDPIFGPVLMFGLGGIFVEILEDVAFRAIPLSRHDARSMVEQIKARKVLKGVRGEAAVDKEALLDLLLKVSSIVEAYPELAELDLNPVMAYDDGYAIVDARIIVNQAVVIQKDD